MAVYFPQLYTVAKWGLLALIGLLTGIVGFTQSLVVAGLYRGRSNFIYDIVQKEELGRWKSFAEYTLFNFCLAVAASLALAFISPAASGSGIPDVKAFLNGVESPLWKNFFTIRTFITKVIGSSLAVASSLVMGKEGPMLHAGSILAVILGNNRWIRAQMERAAHWGTFTYNLDLRDLVVCGAAAGVCAAFRAPVGGILFAFEMSTRFRKELLWRCLLVCSLTMVIIRAAVKKCIDSHHCRYLSWGSLAWFQQKYDTPYEQVPALIVLALCGGYLGSLFTTFNTWICIVRKRWGKKTWARVLEVGCISLLTSTIFFFMPGAGRCMSCDTGSDIDPHHCVQGGAKFRTFSGFHCGAGTYNDMAVLIFNPQGFVIQGLFTTHAGTFSMSTLLFYGSVFWILGAVTYGAFIPSGLFTPSLIFGGCLGRLFAEVLVQMHLLEHTSVGLYALLGAASFAGGLMRYSASLCLILMEMTGDPAPLPFLMLVLIVAKGVGDRFNYSVFDHQMMLKGLGFVGVTNHHTMKKSRLNAVDVMTRYEPDSQVFHITETSEIIQHALNTYTDKLAFPVCENQEHPDEAPGFVGLISREHAQALLNEAGPDCEKIDLRSKVEVAPVIIPTNMPLTFVYSIMNTLGFDYLPVLSSHGPLEGIVSRQDMVDVQNQKLDRFHLQEKIDIFSQEVQMGDIKSTLTSGTQMFKGHFTEPLRDARHLLRTSTYVRHSFHHESDDEEMPIAIFLSERDADGRPPLRRSGTAPAHSLTRHEFV